MTASWTLFDRLADRYDQVIPFFAAFAEQLLDTIGPVPGGRLLDIGTGRGAVAVAAAARGHAVTALDAAPRMVSHLAAAHPELDVRRMDVHRLELPDGSYDVATGGFVIHLVANPAVVLTELRRVLRPGATVALTTPGPGDDRHRWDTFDAIADEFAARATRPRPAGLDVAAALRAAGFVAVRAERTAVHLPVADPRTCWDFLMSHGFAARVEALDDADGAEFRRRALAELTRMHRAGGIVVDRGAVVHLAVNPGPPRAEQA